MSKELGITQKSAWFLCHRIREACREDEMLLSSIVEMDETYIGGKEKNRPRHKRTKGTQGRSTLTKTEIVGMRSRDGRIKAASMAKVDSHNINERISENIEPGTCLLYTSPSPRD